MPPTPIRTDEAPAAIGPYSQAVVAGNTVYCSGQIALTPAGEMLSGDVRVQTEQVIANLAAVLRAAGCGFEDVVKTTVYLTDLADFPVMNDVYGQRFPGGSPPARATVQVSALPKGARVEIDAIAVRPQRARPEARRPWSSTGSSVSAPKSAAATEIPVKIPK